MQVEDIRDYDLSAKNPNKVKEEALKSPSEIFDDIERRNDETMRLMLELKNILKS